MVKHILVLSNTSAIGGAEISLYEFVAHVTSKPTGYRFFIACPPDSPLAHKLKRHDVEVISVPLFRFSRPRNPLALARFLALALRANLYIYHIIRRKRIDLLHANNSSACLQGILAAKLSRVPIVWHVRDITPLSIAGRLLEAWADHIITISNAVRDKVVRKRVDKVTTIYNGILLTSRLEENNGWADGQDQSVSSDIIVVAQFVPWKRHALMIDVVAKLKAEKPDIKLLFVGAQHDNSASQYARCLLDRVKDACLQDNIAFSSHRDDLYELIRRSKVLAHPAVGEPMGRVIAEALLLKTPVVAVRSGGVPEIIEDGIDGFLVQPDDVEGLSLAIRKILQSQVGKTLAENGYIKAKRMFDIDQQSGKILGIYGRLLAARPVAGGPC